MFSLFGSFSEGSEIEDKSNTYSNCITNNKIGHHLIQNIISTNIHKTANTPKTTQNNHIRKQQHSIHIICIFMYTSNNRFLNKNTINTK